MSSYFGLKPWLIECVTDNSFQKHEGKVLKVCKHVQGPMSDGSVIKEVSDIEVFTFAVFTREALNKFEEDWLEDDEDSQVPTWDSSTIIIRKYELQHRLYSTQINCDYLLIVREFVLCGVQEGFKLKNDPKYIMDVPAVRSKSNTLWQQHRDREQQVELSTTDSEFSHVNLSLLLRAMEKVDSSSDSQTQKQDAVAGPSNQGRSTSAVNSQQGTTTDPSLLSSAADVSYFVISEEDAKKLDAIEEWQPKQPPSSPQKGSSESIIVEDSDSLSAFDVPATKKRRSDRLKHKAPDNEDANEAEESSIEPMVFTRQKAGRKLVLVRPQATLEGQSSAVTSSDKSCDKNTAGTEPRSRRVSGNNIETEMETNDAAASARPELVNTSVQVTQSLFGEKHSQEAQVGLSLCAGESQQSQPPCGEALLPSTALNAHELEENNRARSKNFADCAQSTQVDDISESQVPSPDFPVSPLLIPLNSQLSSQRNSERNKCRGILDFNLGSPSVISESGNQDKLVIAVPARRDNKTPGLSNAEKTSDEMEEERLEVLRTPTHGDVGSSRSEAQQSDFVVVIDSTDEDSQPKGPVVKTSRLQSKKLIAEDDVSDENDNVTGSFRTSKCATNNNLKPVQSHIVINRKGHVGIEGRGQPVKNDVSALFVKPGHADETLSRRGKRKLFTGSSKPFAESPKEDNSQFTLEDDIIAFAAGNPKGTVSSISELNEEKRDCVPSMSETSDCKKQQSHHGASPSSSGESVINRLTVQTPVNSLPSHQPPPKVARRESSPLPILPETSSTTSLLASDSNINLDEIQTLISRCCQATTDSTTGSKLPKLKVPDHLRVPIATYFCRSRTDS